MSDNSARTIYRTCFTDLQLEDPVLASLDTEMRNAAMQSPWIISSVCNQGLCVSVREIIFSLGINVIWDKNGCQMLSCPEGWAKVILGCSGAIHNSVGVAMLELHYNPAEKKAGSYFRFSREALKLSAEARRMSVTTINGGIFFQV
jgi:hypothetical protein